MNILYIGIENPIEVAVEGVKAKDLVAEIKGGELKGENGKFVFVPDGSIRFTSLKIGILNKRNLIWLDSLEYRVRMPERITLFGTNDGGSISYGELITVDRLNGDMGCGFGGCDPVCYQVMQYHLTAIKDDLIYTEQVYGNRISPQSRRILAQFKDGGYVLITNVRAKWCGKTKVIDTTISLNSMILKVRGVKFPGELYIIRGAYWNGISRRKFAHVLNLDNPDFNIPFANKIKDSTWTITKALDNSLIGEINFSHDTIIETKTFYPENKVKTKSLYDYKNSTSTYIAFHENGLKSIEANAKIIHDQIFTLNAFQLFEVNNFKRYYKFPLLIGEYKSYFENGKLKEIGNFDTTTVFETVLVMKEGSEDPYDTEEMEIGTTVSVRHGLWKFYNEKGNLIRQTIYDKGRIKE